LEAGAFQFKAWLEVLLERRRNNSIKAINGKIHNSLQSPMAALLSEEDRTSNSTLLARIFQLALVCSTASPVAADHLALPL